MVRKGCLWESPKEERVNTPSPIPSAKELTSTLLGLCGKSSHWSGKDGLVSLKDGLFVMKLVIVLLRFQILENYSSVGSKGQTSSGNFFLGFHFLLGVRQVPGDGAL